MLNVIAIIFHLVAINIWVGGMFFIIVVLGKVVAAFPQSQQQQFWQAVLSRFFSWVWLAVIVLLGSGVAMLFSRFDGPSMAPAYVLLMAGLGISMVSLFLLIYFVYYRKFQIALENGDNETAQGQLKLIRRVGIVNMLLGFCVVIVIGSGPYLFY